MNAPASVSPRVWLLTLVLPLTTALPTLAFGFTREDWLFLWSALDPATAPEGATGVFVRPVATALWRAVTALAGDQPLGMHVAMLLVATMFVLGTVRLLIALDIRKALPLCVGAVIVGGHAALIETRLWASASNGLLAGALGTWGAALLLTPRWRWLGAPLLLLAGGARADAWLLALVPLLVWAESRRSIPAGAVATVATVTIAVAAYVRYSTFEPSHTGELLRRLLLPWGPALSAAAAFVLGAVAVVGLAVAGWIWLRQGPSRAGIGLVAVPLVAAAFVPWTPAGRYLLVPVVGLSMIVAHQVVIRPNVKAWVPLGVWIALNLGTNWVGGSVRELWQRGMTEGDLYHAAQRMQIEGTALTLVDPPPMGWRGEPADAENVVSAAVRRPIAVHYANSVAAAVDGPILAYREGRWKKVR